MFHAQRKHTCISSSPSSRSINQSYLHAHTVRTISHRPPTSQHPPPDPLTPHPPPPFPQPHPSNTTTNKLIPPRHPPPRGPHPIHAPLLILPQPRLQRLPQHALPHEINDQPTDDAHERDGIHPVDVLVEDLDADHHAPEVPRQQGDVEKGRRREPEHDGRPGVEDEQAERVPRQVAPDLPVAPHRLRVARPVEDARHGPVDPHAPEPQLAHDLVQRPLADQELLGHVAHAVKGRAGEGEEVALELVAAGDAAEAGPLRNVVGAEEDADAADADEDADDLGGVVADVEEDGRDEDDHDDGPEVDELGWMGHESALIRQKLVISSCRTV